MIIIVRLQNSVYVPSTDILYNLSYQAGLDKCKRQTDSFDNHLDSVESMDTNSDSQHNHQHTQKSKKNQSKFQDNLDKHRNSSLDTQWQGFHLFKEKKSYVTNTFPLSYLQVSAVKPDIKRSKNNIAS